MQGRNFLGGFKLSSVCLDSYFFDDLFPFSPFSSYYWSLKPQKPLCFKVEFDIDMNTQNVVNMSVYATQTENGNPFID